MHFNYRTWSAFFPPEPSISCQTIRCRWNDFYDFTTRICSLPTFDRRREKLPEFHLALSGAHPTPPRKMGIKYKKSSSTRSSFWCLSVEAGWGGVIYVLFHVSVCMFCTWSWSREERERELWNASEMCLLCFTLDLEGFRLLPVPVFWGVYVLFEEKIVGALVFLGT